VVSLNQKRCEDGKYVGKDLRLHFKKKRASVFIIDSGLLIKESPKFSHL
jgi:hypothetical protein